MAKHLLRSTPESVGISSHTLCKLLAELKKLDSLNSIMVMRHGHVCAEGWWKPYSPDIPHSLFSLSKASPPAPSALPKAKGCFASATQ